MKREAHVSPMLGVMYFDQLGVFTKLVLDDRTKNNYNLVLNYNLTTFAKQNITKWKSIGKRIINTTNSG